MSINITNKIAIIAILLISFFGMNLEEGKGQNPCPTGYSSYIWTEVIGGCSYQIEVCYLCSPTSGGTQHFYINNVIKLDVSCSGTMNMVQVMNYLNTKIASVAFIYARCTGIGPCEEGGTEIQILTPICWTKKLVTIGSQTGVYYTSCFWDESYCSENWKYCYNSLTGLFETILVWRVISGDPACGEEPTTVSYNWSDCFYLKTNCTYP